MKQISPLNKNLRKLTKTKEKAESGHLGFLTVLYSIEAIVYPADMKTIDGPVKNPKFGFFAL